MLLHGVRYEYNSELEIMAINAFEEMKGQGYITALSAALPSNSDKLSDFIDNITASFYPEERIGQLTRLHRMSEKFDKYKNTTFEITKVM